MDRFHYEDHAGARLLLIVAVYEGHDWNGHVLHDVDEFRPWIVTWTDGINVWTESWHDVSVALARFAALVRSADTGVFLAHDVQNRGEKNAFAAEAERFLATVVLPG